MTARFRRIIRIGLATALSVVATPAIAQVPATTPAAATPANDRNPAPRKKGQPRVIQIDAVTVEGEVQKPEAFYILQRSELNFKGLEPARRFIPSIIESVEKDPF